LKKKLLPLLLLMSLSTAAQASITLFGTIDTGLGFKSLKNKDTGDKVTDNGLFNGVWSSNSWGLKGSETLGDGWTTSFKLESGFNSLTGEGSKGQMFKTTELTLANERLGSLTAGRVGNAVQSYAGDIAGPDDEEGLSDIGNIFSAAGSNKASNTIVYASPTFQGWDFAVGYSFNTNGEQSFNKDENTKLITTAFGYSEGPIQFAAGYDRLKANPWEKAVHSWIVTGSYDFSVLTLAMAVGQDINGRQSGLGSYAPAPAFKYWNSGYTPDFKTTGFTVNATVPVNAVSSAMVGWATSRASSSFNKRYDLAKRQQNIFSAGYSYNLSKRTTLYALGAYVNGFSFQNVRGQQAIVGIDHSF